MITGKHLIAGKWIEGDSKFASEPAHGEAHDFSVGTPAHVDAAVAAAEEAFWSFGYSTRAERAAFLRTIAEEIDARGDEITQIGTQESGLPEARLIGERGRELRDFLERDLGEEGMKRSVVAVATSDTPALVRLKAAYTGTAVAEFFRDQGYNVMLMMDSVTRFAMAQREVGLAIGEPPATKGYTPSCFALLPKLMERAGTSPKGTITAVYTVLVDGDDMNEPIADAVRGILDGHIILSRKLAHQNHYPAIDILGSVSRVMNQMVTPEHRQTAGQMRVLLADLAEARELLALGGYERGNSAEFDRALAAEPALHNFLRQDDPSPIAFPQLVAEMSEV